LSDLLAAALLRVVRLGSADFARSAWLFGRRR
jgi:hypothetical protein